MSFGALHVMPGGAFATYQAKRVANLRISGPLMRLDLWLPANGIVDPRPWSGAAEWVVFHAWKRGYLAIDGVAHRQLCALRAGAPVSEANASLAATLTQLGWDHDGVPELDGVVLRAMYDFAALQNPRELAQLLTRLRPRAPAVIVEIGTSSGGLFFALGQVAAPTATLISIDAPEPVDLDGPYRAVGELLPALVSWRQTAHVIRGGSRQPATLGELARALDGRPIDLLVIDGDHTLDGVRGDFDTYSPLVKAGGLIVLHDIVVTPENMGPGFEVGLLWPELAARYRTETLVDGDAVEGARSQIATPLAQRRPTAFGFGLIEW